MRGFVYTIAVLAAIGIGYVIATSDPEPVSETEAVATAVESGSEVMAEAGTLTLSVPNMHCPVVCYPKVKETLEASKSVTEVALDEQKEEGIIDNRQVIVHYDSGFDLQQALATLSKAGFSEADVV